ncbi:hypothetical protein BJ742DRAFT_814947 [Cladochytrium replicatum]|nr:hypothetical protein BJ742DRAFT_814947 [Cladochytrium replicatum]
MATNFLLSLPDDVLLGPLIAYAIPHPPNLYRNFSSQGCVSMCFDRCSDHRYVVVLSQTCRRLRSLLLPSLLHEKPVVLIAPEVPNRFNRIDGLEQFHQIFYLNTPTPSPLLQHFRTLHLGIRISDEVGMPGMGMGTIEVAGRNGGPHITDVVKVLAPTIQTLHLWTLEDPRYLEDICAAFGKYGNLKELVVHIDFGKRLGTDGVKTSIQILGKFLRKLHQLRSLHFKCSKGSFSSNEILSLTEGLSSLHDMLIHFSWEWTANYTSTHRDFSSQFLSVGMLIGDFLRNCKSLRSLRLYAKIEHGSQPRFPGSQWADILSGLLENNQMSNLTQLELHDLPYQSAWTDEITFDGSWVLSAAHVLERGFWNLRSLKLGFVGADSEEYAALGSAIAALPDLERLSLDFSGTRFKAMDGKSTRPLFWGLQRAARLSHLQVIVQTEIGGVLPSYFDALASSIAGSTTISNVNLMIHSGSFIGMENLAESLMKYTFQMASHLRMLGLDAQINDVSRFKQAWAEVMKVLLELPSLRILDVGETLHRNFGSLDRRLECVAMVRKELRELKRNLILRGHLY